VQFKSQVSLTPRNNGFRDARFRRHTIFTHLAVLHGGVMQFEIESSWSQLVLFRSLRPGRELKVVVVYEEVQMGLQGKKISDLIAREAGRAAAQLTVWRFDLIGSAGMTRAATRQAEEADVIIVAPRHPDTLPPQVCVWLDAWSAIRTPAHGALIALFDARTAVTSRRSTVAMLLRRAAHRAEMNYFFCKVPVLAKPAARSPYPAVAKDRA
jgi:hypothetical protein